MLSARRVIPLVALVLAATLAIVAWAARQPDRTQVAVVGGSPSRGHEALERLGCGSCHTIPGVRDADSMVGPPLIRFAERAYIAGRLPNTAGNLIRWIISPQSVEPGTAMPDLGVPVPTARDIAAYLYTLGDRDRFNR